MEPLILEEELGKETIDCFDLNLVHDHASKPIWVCSNGSIYVEVHCPLAKKATDFLIAIAEPQSRPNFIHHYKLTAYSLYAGASVNFTTTQILRTMVALSKNELPASIVRFIEHFTQSYGKVKLVLRRNRVFVESMDEEILRYLLKDVKIRGAMLTTSSSTANNNTAIPVQNEGDEHSFRKTKRMKDSTMTMEEELVTDATYVEEEEEVASSFEIMPTAVGEVKEAASRLNYPMLEEYQYEHDDVNPDLDLQLKANVATRSYQDKAISKMFANQNARSGVIVLPCGAGKTLTGIIACCKIHKSTLVLCSNVQAVHQWIAQFKHFTTLPANRVAAFVSQERTEFPVDGSAVLLVTTYSMMGVEEANRSLLSRNAMQQIRAREWGLVILDEVHMAPANQFRKALFQVRTHCKLGLTATLVREDGKIDDLNFLIGPKLFEADWMQLTRDGHLARVQCAEVLCPMSQVFMKAYLNETHSRGKQFLYVMNPNKLACCERLMLYHEARQDKILVFSDTVAAVKEYGDCLGGETATSGTPGRAIMHGSFTDSQRREILAKFRLPYHAKGSLNTLVISSIGDIAIDLPEANVLIQVSSHFGSRRQEAQRLGRILRPKSGQSHMGAYNAYFYTLVSSDTRETLYSEKRRQYLMDQGYSFKNIPWNHLFPESGDFHSAAVQVQKLASCTLKKMLEAEAKEKKAFKEAKLIED
jgi:DNA excision repair protein ERCC-3